jgi:hypothetical protein
MSEAINQPTPGNRRSPFPFEIIDLTTHPDGQLLRLCAEMTKLQERWDRAGLINEDLGHRYWAVADAIAAIHPETADGLTMKAMVALGMISPSQRKMDEIGMTNFFCWGGIVSVVKDVLRGVPA